MVNFGRDGVNNETEKNGCCIPNKIIVILRIIYNVIFYKNSVYFLYTLPYYFKHAYIFVPVQALY